MNLFNLINLKLTTKNKEFTINKAKNIKISLAILFNFYKVFFRFFIFLRLMNMKKFSMLVVLLLLCLFFIWCNNNDKENWEDSIAKVTDNLCVEEWWKMETVTEWWENFDLCIFDDESFCFVEDLEGGACKKWDIQYYDVESSDVDAETWMVVEDEKLDCGKLPVNIVCGKDGNTYNNSCYLDEAWVEEESELAEVIDWECVFG